MRPLTLAVLLAGLVLAGCADDGPGAEERARLADSLGFLSTDLGLSDEEVACTAEAIEEGMGDEDLDEVATAVRRVDAGEVGLDELPDDVSATITESVASCAGAS